MTEEQKNIILVSNALNQSLFELYDIMTIEQRERWKAILEWEEKELMKIDGKYLQENIEMEKRHAIEWVEFSEDRNRSRKYGKFQEPSRSPVFMK